MQIPLVDLKKQYRNLDKDFNHILKKIFISGNFIKGEYLERFEKDFAKFIGTKFCLGVASGTEALHLSLLAQNIGKGDEVILPVNTFIATSYAILYAGAKPIFVDADKKTYNIDTKLIERKITKKTKAIIPVHLYGQPAKMDEIMKLAKRYKLFVVEDACQAHGASYKNKNVGTFGNLAAFSFYPSKNLGAFGDGGAITTNSSKLYNVLKRLREYGYSTSRYHYNRIGFNSRLDTIQAAILIIKLKYLKEWNLKRQKLANYYNRKLQEIPLITRPYIERGADSVYNLYVIRTAKRDKLMQYLSSKGIKTGIHYPIPLHLQQSLSDLGYRKGDFPIAETMCREILSIPLYPELTTFQQDYIVESIKEFF